MQQDRATTIAGTLGPGPAMIPVRISLTSERGTKKTFQMAMVNDQLFTPMLAYLSILNTLSAYERQNGAASYVVRGSAVVKDRGAVAFEDLFTCTSPIPTRSVSCSRATSPPPERRPTSWRRSTSS